MSQEKYIQKLLSTLEERRKKGEISQNNFEYLKQKYENKLIKLKNNKKTTPVSTKVKPEEAIFKEAMNKIVTKVYSCDYCGGILDFYEGASKAKCNFCGYINEIDYLRKVSQRMQEDRAQIIRSAMVSFANVTNLDQVKLPVHERFIATAHIYENRALRLENDLGKIDKYGNGPFEEEKQHFLNIRDDKQYYEASKSWHQAAQLYRNAAEFAPTEWDSKNDLATSYYYDGLAFFDSSFAPIRLVKNTFYATVSRYEHDTPTWPYGKNVHSKRCESVEELLVGKNFIDSYTRDYSIFQNEIKKYGHPILIRPEAVDATFRSAMKATKCFLEAYKISNEEKHLVYALISKLLVYIIYVEKQRGSLVSLYILRNIKKICANELYSPPFNIGEGPIDERSLNHSESLKSIAKQLALHMIIRYKDFTLGFETDWTEEKYDWFWGKGGISFLHSGFSLPFGKFVKVDQVFNQKTSSYMVKEDWPPKKTSLKFSWVMGRKKTGLFSYDQPSIYLTIEATKKKAGIPIDYVFDFYFDVFRKLALYPDLLLQHIGKENIQERTLPIKITKGSDDWDIRLNSIEFLDLYYSLVLSFRKIKHSSAKKILRKYSDQIEFIELWKEKTNQLSKTATPTIKKMAKLKILTPEFVNHDLEFISYFVNLISSFKKSKIIKQTATSIKNTPDYVYAINNISRNTKTEYEIVKRTLIPEIHGNIIVEIAKDKEGISWLYPSSINVKANFEDFEKITLDNLNTGKTQDRTPFVGYHKTIIDKKYVDAFIYCTRYVYHNSWKKIRVLVNTKKTAPIFLNNGHLTMTIAPILGKKPKTKEKYQPP